MPLPLLGLATGIGKTLLGGAKKTGTVVKSGAKKTISTGKFLAKKSVLLPTPSVSTPLVVLWQAQGLSSAHAGPHGPKGAQQL